MKIFTKMKHMMLMAAMCWASTALAVNVKGSYAVVADDVESGNKITSVDGITMTYGTDNTWTTGSASETVDSKTFTVYASGSTNPDLSSGNIPTGGIYVVFEPEHDGTITAVVQNAGNSKKAYIVEGPGPDGNLVNGTVLIEGVETSWTSGTPLNSAAAYSGGVTFEVKGGSKYYFYLAGSKMRFMGFIYTYDGYGAELVHTASSFCKATKGVYECTVDAELEYINKSQFGNRQWQGAAYAEFEIAIPEGKTIKSAVLNWTASSGKSYPTTVYYVKPELTLDYEAMSTSGSAINLEGVSFATVTFKNGVADFETDASDAVKAIAEVGQKYIIFKFTGNDGAGNLYGMKAAEEKRPKLTLEFADANAVTTYTVKYVDESGDEIKPESVYDILAGETASITDDNKVAIYKDGKKYIYVSCDKESITTVADGASNVITATFREAATRNYTINAVDKESNVLKVLTGSNFEGETVTVPYNQYIFKGGVLYETSATNKEYNKYITLSSDNMTSDIVYSVSSKTNVVYFSEAEEIEGMTRTTSSNANIRCSNGVGAYNGSETPVEVLTLTPGIYTITAQIWGNQNNKVPVPLYVNCGDETLEVGTMGYLTSGSKEFTVTESSLVTLPKCGDPGKCIDWILIQSVERELVVAEEEDFAPEHDAYTSATYTRAIEAGKYGTICLPFAPDAASLENYTFFTMESAADGVINFVEEEAPVANTPYIYCLKGDNEAITGGVTVVSATLNDVVAGDWTMKGSFTNQAIDATTGNFYGLSSGTIVKANKTLTVKPYRAYFTSEKAAAAVTLRFTRGDETTEISAAELDVQPATVIYDLAGRRVEKMEKGIYIVNGKKVIR